MVDLATDDQRFGAFAFAKSSFCGTLAPNTNAWQTSRNSITPTFS
jgi:hypothetical protein